LYGYVGGDPVLNVDAMGLMPPPGYKRFLLARCTKKDEDVSIAKCGSKFRVLNCSVKIIKKVYSFDPNTGDRVYDPQRIVNCDCDDDPPAGMCR
jgi:hypothetical protein